jgi:hypothetical protein
MQDRRAAQGKWADLICRGEAPVMKTPLSIPEPTWQELKAEVRASIDRRLPRSITGAARQVSL